jgi:hypothetical protein
VRARDCESVIGTLQPPRARSGTRRVGRAAPAPLTALRSAVLTRQCGGFTLPLVPRYASLPCLQKLRTVAVPPPVGR